jgi:lathosterol oxidase
MEELLHRFLLLFTVSYLRYFFFAGVTFAALYIFWRSYFNPFKIQERYPINTDVKREIFHSSISLLIFTFIGTIIFWLKGKGYTKIYIDFNDYSTIYFIFSVIAAIFIHDAYFYWTHRFMHWKKIYRHVHKVHHLSVNPTPWAAFAFHPIEAVVEIGILPLLVFTIPMHPLAIVSWIVYMTVMNVVGHSGFELFPKGFTRGKITGLHNCSVHHNMHHKYARSNYGLYFNFWDQLMGTNDVKYHEEYDQLKQRTELQRKTGRSTTTDVESPSTV